MDKGNTDWQCIASFGGTLHLTLNFKKKTCADSEWIVERIQHSLDMFWTEIGMEMLKRSSFEHSCPLMQVLIMSKLSWDWSGSVIEAVWSMYQERILRQTYKTENIQQIYKKNAMKLLKRAIEIKNKELLIILKPALENQRFGVAVNVSSEWQNAVTSVREMEALLGKILVQGVLTKKRKAKPGRQYDKFTADIEKLFAGRIEYIVDLEEYSKAEAMDMMCKVMLKNVLENVRKGFKGGEEYKQLQIDMEYAKNTMYVYMKDVQAFDMIIEETVQSAGLTTRDASKMDKSELAGIMSRSIKE
jgi:hypothetical protein